MGRGGVSEQAGRGLGIGLLMWTLAGPGMAFVGVDEPAVYRQRELIRMVRQDCGSCHGMRLTGGLGPALTPQALSDKPVDSLVSTVYAGRPGTPMPPWAALLTETEAHWIVNRLVAGFPEESDGGSP